MSPKEQNSTGVCIVYDCFVQSGVQFYIVMLELIIAA